MPAIPTEPGRPPDVTAPEALLSFIGVVLLLAFGASIAVTAASDIAPMHAALILWIALSYSVSGLVAWWRRPANRLGTLMVVTGFTTLASTLYWAENPVLHTVGVALDVVVLVLIVHVFLAFPTGQLRGRFEHLLLTIGYVSRSRRSAPRHAARWAGSEAGAGSRRRAGNRHRHPWRRARRDQPGRVGRCGRPDRA